MVKRLARLQIIAEPAMCSLIDWTIRNEGRFRSGPSGSQVKTTSILRDQHGRYSALCHHSNDPDFDFISVWDPEDTMWQFNVSTINTDCAPVHRRDSTMIHTSKPYSPVVIFHRESVRSGRDPHIWRRGIVRRAHPPHTSQWSFFLEQGGNRYAYDASPLRFYFSGKVSRPRIYEPITHRGQYLNPSVRKSASDLKKDYQIMDEITAPYDYAMDIRIWIDYLKALYDEHLNNPDSHQDISRGLAKLSIGIAESLENRWHDRRHWEYMGHIATHFWTGEVDHDMYDVPRQLYDMAVEEAQPFRASRLLPTFDVETEGKSYVYRIIAGMGNVGPWHLLSFQRKPKRIRPTI